MPPQNRPSGDNYQGSRVNADSISGDNRPSKGSGPLVRIDLHTHSNRSDGTDQSNPDGDCRVGHDANQRGPEITRDRGAGQSRRAGDYVKVTAEKIGGNIRSDLQH